MIEIIYSSTTQKQGKPVAASYLTDCGISFEECVTLDDFRDALEEHDDFEAVEVLEYDD